MIINHLKSNFNFKIQTKIKANNKLIQAALEKERTNPIKKIKSIENSKTLRKKLVVFERKMVIKNGKKKAIMAP